MLRPLTTLFLIGAGTTAMPARAETSNCTNITSLPAVINTQGVYCLKQDLSTAATSGAAITIDANNVTLDCNSWKIGGLAAGTGTATRGIRANNRVNITIRNCTIRGFHVGIELNTIGAHAAGYHLVEDNRLDLNTYKALDLEGDGTTVRDNFIFDTGGSTLTPHAYGMDVSDNADVIGNTVGGVAGTAGGNGALVGIAMNGNIGGEASRNRVWGLVADGTGNFRGIWSNGGRPVIRDNSVINHAASNPPAAGDYGLVCNQATAVARDNVVSGFGAPATPVLNCTSIANTTVD
jgi:hypothetical protein